MKYKNGFLVALGVSALSLSLIACGGDDDDNGGTAGTSAAGTSAAGTSATGGKSGSGTGGKNNGGTSNAGTNGGGTDGGGTDGGGASGSGGSGGPPVSDAVKSIGFQCSSDSDCGDGGKCLLADGKDLGDGGPANGYCTIDCTQWLKDSDGKNAPDLPSPYPCQPDVNINDTNAAISNFCLNFGDANNVQGFCVQLCSYGDPPLEGLTGKLDSDKCGGRNDTVCYPLTSTDANDPTKDGVLQLSFCRPYCQSDDQCNQGSYCDHATGLCVAGAAPTKTKNGGKCTAFKTGDDQNTYKNDCESGICLRLYNEDDKTVPAAHINDGFCGDPCVFNDIEQGTDSSCGGFQNGICLYSVFDPKDPKDPSKTISAASGDIGVCAQAATTDADCLWQNGFFTFDLARTGGGAQGLNVCTLAQECTSNLDCAYTCTADADCVDPKDATTKTNKCSSGKCVKSDGSADGYTTCRKVDAFCGKSYCLDHDVKGLPTNGDVACIPGAGGSGGAGGSAGSAGSAGSGTAGTAGAGGAAAGASGKAGSAGGLSLRSHASRPERFFGPR